MFAVRRIRYSKTEPLARWLVMGQGKVRSSFVA